MSITINAVIRKDKINSNSVDIRTYEYNAEYSNKENLLNINIVFGDNPDSIDVCKKFLLWNKYYYR